MKNQSMIQEKYLNIFEDGRFGQYTLENLETYLKSEDSSYLLKLMNILQGMHYIENLRKSHGQEDYVKRSLKKMKIAKDIGAIKQPAPPTDFRIE